MITEPEPYPQTENFNPRVFGHAVMEKTIELNVSRRCREERDFAMVILIIVTL